MRHLVSYWLMTTSLAVGCATKSAVPRQLVPATQQQRLGPEDCPRELQDAEGRTQLERIDQLVVFRDGVSYQGVYRVVSGERWGLGDAHRIYVQCGSLRVLDITDPAA